MVPNKSFEIYIWHMKNCNCSDKIFLNFEVGYCSKIHFSFIMHCPRDDSRYSAYLCITRDTNNLIYLQKHVKKKY